jgi:hypothetical protein
MSQSLLGPVFARCGAHLPKIDSAYLDCVSDTLAVLLAARGVEDVRTPFACDWRFDLIEEPEGPHRLDLPPRGQDDLLGRRTGWRPRWQPIVSLDTDLPVWRDMLASGVPVVLVGDAFGLPWTPYSGHEHMDHGFVLEGIEHDGETTAHIVDPYENATQWGRALPVCTRVSLRSLASALTGGRWAVLEPAAAAPAIPPGAVLLGNARAILTSAEQGHYQRFVDQYRPLRMQELTHLALQTWLLTRSRGLHGRWLATLPEDVLAARLRDRFADEVETSWQRAAEITYLALRRVGSGRAAPTSVLTALQTAAEAEAAFAAEVLAGGGQPAC